MASHDSIWTLRKNYGAPDKSFVNLDRQQEPTLASRPVPRSRYDRGIKRAFDLLVSTAGLIAFAPMILAASIAIKFDSRGPIFIRQTRHGYNGQTVRVLKFRSTEDSNSHCPRVTRLGRVLRRTGIDALPQLFNVLRGEMSIVGPRPNTTGHDMFDGQIRQISRRHIKPGIIGWAQLHGYRGETRTFCNMKQFIEHDLYYAENWSLLLDIKIILLTLLSEASFEWRRLQ
jgi:lipopolysaccharide/colanic/teichoic acid biosynthesis glycosyltransferase